MRIRTSLVGLAAVVGALAAAAPASAAECTEIKNGGAAFGVEAVCIPAQTGVRAGVTVTHVARAENLGWALSSTDTNMGVQCAAQSTGAAGTGIVDCFLRGLHTGRIHRVGDRDALPGTTDANVGASLFIPMEPFEVCVRSRVLLRDASSFYETPLSCATN